jgi:hypothetical protein
MDDIERNRLSDEFVDKIWSIIYEKQESINQQMEESERKYNLQLEENKNLIEESEKKFFLRMEEKSRHLVEVDSKINKQLEENRTKPHEEPQEEDKKAGRVKLKNFFNKRKKNNYYIEIEVSPKADIKDTENSIARLQTLMKDAGFNIVDQSGNTMKITLPEN